jgi:diacylglycerol kinase
MNLIAQTYCERCQNTIHNSIGILKTISLTSGQCAFAQGAGTMTSFWLVIGYVLFMTLCFAVILFVVAEALNAIEELMDDDDQ